MLERTASPLGLARLAVERVCNKEVKHAWKSQSVDWRHRHHQINHSFPFEDCGWHIFKPDIWVFGVWALSLLSSLSHLPFFFVYTYCYAQIKIWLICRIQSLLTLGKELSLESVTFPGGLWWWFFRESDTRPPFRYVTRPRAPAITGMSFVFFPLFPTWRFLIQGVCILSYLAIVCLRHFILTARPQIKIHSFSFVSLITV